MSTPQDQITNMLVKMIKTHQVNVLQVTDIILGGMKVAEAYTTLTGPQKADYVVATLQSILGNSDVNTNIPANTQKVLKLMLDNEPIIYGAIKTIADVAHGNSGINKSFKPLKAVKRCFCAQSLNP